MAVSIAVRWADNTAQLRDHLREGLNQIEATSAGADRLVKAFSGEKLIAAAHNQVAALQKMGGAMGALAGVEKLSAAEKERINALITKAIEKYTLLGQTAPKALHDIAAATKATETQTNTWSSVLGKATGLLGAFGIGLSAAAVVGFGKSLLGNADSLVKMSDKTGLSITWLQRFQVAGDDAGNTVEEMSAAINQMQNRLVGGDKSFVSALQLLNINIDEFRKRKPEEQFVEISDALRKIEDPALRVNIAMDLFGKTGAAVLPTLTRGFDDVKNAAVAMSDETARKLDAAGDRLEAWWRRFKAISAQAIVGAADVLGAVANAGGVDAREAAARAIAMHGVTSTAATARLISPGGADRNTAGVASLLSYGAQLALVREQVAKLTAADRAEIAAAQQLGTGQDVIAAKFKISEGALRLLNDEMRQSKTTAKDAAKELKPFVDRVHEIETGVPPARQKLLGLIDALNTIPFGLTPVKQLGADFSALGPVLGVARIEGEKFGIAFDKWALGILPAGTKEIAGAREEVETLGEAFQRTLENVPDLLVKAFTGGGGLKGAAQAIGTKFTMSLFGANGAFSSAAAKATGFLTGTFGKTIGGALGAALPGIGALIGPAIEGIAKLFSKIFGPSEAEKVNKMRDAFQKTFGPNGAGGTFDDMAKRAQRAGYDVQRLLDASTVKAYTKEVERLNAAIAFQDGAVSELASIEEKYHLTLNRSASELFRSYRLLTAAGHDADEVLREMKDDWQGLINDALKYGTTLPVQLQPIIESLITQGLLVDATGEKLTDINQLSFSAVGDEMTTQFGRMTEVVERLDEAIRMAFGLPLTEAQEEARKLQRELDAVNEKFRIYDFFNPGRRTPGEPPPGVASGGLVTSLGVQRFAGGGNVLPFFPRRIGSDTVPAMLTPGELVMNEGQQHAVGQLLQAAGGASGHGGGGPLVVQVVMNRKVIGEAIIEDFAAAAFRHGLR